LKGLIALFLSTYQSGLISDKVTVNRQVTLLAIYLNGDRVQRGLIEVMAMSRRCGEGKVAMSLGTIKMNF
jgi:hypothetical protein